MGTFSSKGKKPKRDANTATPAQEPVTAQASSTSRTWSAQQKAIFDFAKKHKRKNLVVTARAGTGKTTTILETIKYLDGNVLLCAFNKRIATELQERVAKQDGPAADVLTLHALGYKLLRKRVPTAVSDERARTIASKAFSDVQKPSSRDSLRALMRLASLCKETLGSAAMDAPSEKLAAVDINYGVTDLLNSTERENVLAALPFVLERASQLDGECDFSDMLWLPLVNDLAVPSYDHVIVDEAQDMNAAQLELAQRVCRGRLIVVGDDRQAIYGFRGAASDSLARLKESLGAEELKLTTTYRCPSSVVREANAYVPDFVAAPSAPAGNVRVASYNTLMREARPGDFVLSRANAPLMSACLSFVRAGKRAKVEGKDIGKGLAGIVMKLRPPSIEQVSPLVYEWAAKVSKRLDPEKQQARIEQINDQAEAIAAIAEECGSVDELLKQIDYLFSDTYGSRDLIVCSTVHKAKGLEASRVFVLKDTFKRARQSAEESNIAYVAVTRAMQELIYVTKGASDEDLRRQYEVPL